MTQLNISNLIYIEPIQIDFSNKQFIIQFLTKFKTRKANSDSTNLFSKNKSINFEIKQLKNKTQIDVDMVLFKHTSVKFFKNLLGYLIKYNFKINIEDSFTVIGNSNLNLSFKSNYSEFNGNYIDEYIEWYDDNYISLTSSLTTSKTVLFPKNFISRVSICCVPKINNVYINLSILLKMLNKQLGKYATLHDDLLNSTFNNNENLMYIKTFGKLIDETHLSSLNNCLCIYSNIEITENVYIDSIIIKKTGEIIFSVYSIKLETIENILNHSIKYINTNFDDIFQTLKIDFGLYFTQNENSKLHLKKITKADYNIYSTNILASFTFTIDDKIMKSMFKQIMKFTNSRFGSNTSLSIYGFNTYDKNTITKFNEVKNLTLSNYQLQIAPEIHFSKIKKTDKIMIRCSRFNSIDELFFNLYFYFQFGEFGNIKDSKHNKTSNNLNEESKNLLDEINMISPKQNLKNLLTHDPILFKSQIYENGVEKSYSAICQINEQRPILITLSDYQILYPYIPESLYNIINQTFNGRSYYVCGDKVYKYANYHKFDNGQCIIRCTSKKSNPVQYSECSNILKSENIQSHDITYTSNNIIQWTENLNSGKYCLLPPELYQLFPDYVCVNAEDIVPKGMTIDEFVFKNYKLSVINLIRINLIKTYVINSAYTFKIPSTIILSTNTIKNKYYFIVHFTSGKIFKSHEHPEIKNLLNCEFARRSLYEKLRLFIGFSAFGMINGYSHDEIIKLSDVMSYKQNMYDTFVELSKYGKLIGLKTEYGYEIKGFVCNNIVYTFNAEFLKISRYYNFAFEDINTVYKNIQDNIYRFPTLYEVFHYFYTAEFLKENNVKIRFVMEKDDICYGIQITYQIKTSIRYNSEYQPIQKIKINKETLNKIFNDYKRDGKFKTLVDIFETEIKTFDSYFNPVMSYFDINTWITHNLFNVQLNRIYKDYNLTKIIDEPIYLWIERMLIMFKMTHKDMNYESIDKFKIDFFDFIKEFDKANKIFVDKDEDVHYNQYNEFINLFNSYVKIDEVEEAFDKKYLNMNDVINSIVFVFKQNLKVYHGINTKKII